MKLFPALLTIFVSLILVPALTWGQPYLRVEPSLAVQVDWDLTANGMLYVSYDLDHSGKANYHTLRVVERSFASTETLYEVGKSFPGHQVFFVNYSSYAHFYVAHAEPLFYAVDVNEDGRWDLIYKDVMQDGVNGNETFYESPSGMFGAVIAHF